LQGALESLAARSSFGNTAVRFRSRVDAPITLDLEARNHLFRIAQEAVQNALKHARARVVEIDLRAYERAVSLTVNDDGVGLPKQGSPNAGLGMRTMHFRASSIGGRLVITSRREGGVCIACEVTQPPLAGTA
jgi:two-component system, LuxR family, sensor kinase FixL